MKNETRLKQAKKHSETLVTNFSKEDFEKYEKAVNEFNKKNNNRLFLRKLAFVHNDKLLKDSNSLHDKLSGSLSDFWDNYFYNR